LRVPHQKYVAYLLSRGAVGTDVNELLQQGNLPALEDEELLVLRRKHTYIAPPDIPVQARKAGVYFLFDRTPAVKEALGTLHAPYRHMLEVLLTGRVATWDMVSIINDRYGMTPTDDGIKAYANYFWDLQGFTSDAFFAYSERYKTVKAEQRDLWVAWEQGPATAMSRMGRTGNIDSARAMEDIFESAYINYMSVAREDPLCDDVSKGAVRWAKILFDAHGIRSAEGMNLGMIMAAIERFVVRNDPSALKQILNRDSPGANLAGMDGDALYDGDPRDISIAQLEGAANIMGTSEED